MTVCHILQIAGGNVSSKSFAGGKHCCPVIPLLLQDEFCSFVSWWPGNNGPRSPGHSAASCSRGFRLPSHPSLLLNSPAAVMQPEGKPCIWAACVRLKSCKLASPEFCNLGNAFLVYKQFVTEMSCFGWYRCICVLNVKQRRPQPGISLLCDNSYVGRRFCSPWDLVLEPSIQKSRILCNLETSFFNLVRQVHSALYSM